MFCAQCGTENSDEAKFCVKCGTAIASGAVKATGGNAAVSGVAESTDSRRVEEASKYHRYIIVTVLLSIISVVLLHTVPVAQGLIVLGLWVFNVFCCYKLAGALGKAPLLWALLALVGYTLLWIPQLLLINSANKMFRSRGMKIGFLGGATKTE